MIDDIVSNIRYLEDLGGYVAEDKIGSTVSVELKDYVIDCIRDDRIYYVTSTYINKVRGLK